MSLAIERMKLRTVITDNGCWEYQYVAEGGYGIITIAGYVDRTHRIAWRHYKGCIPEGLYVLHKCDNPPCWNPDHLFLGDQQANMDDMIAKGRRDDKSGMNNGNAALSDKQVLEILSLLDEGYLTQKEIGEEYNIAQTTVSYIKRCGWKNLKESAI